MGAQQALLMVGSSLSGDASFSSVSVLLHGEGADASTTITDSSSNALTSSISTLGAAQIDTAQAKYGSASILFAGTGTTTAGDCVDLPGSSLFGYGTGDFTIEMFVRWNSLPPSGGISVLCDHRPAATNGNYFDMVLDQSSGNKLLVFVNNSVQITGTTTPSTGTWYHIAFARVSGTSRLFLNGVQEGSSWSDSTNYVNPSRPRIGASGFHVSPAQEFGLDGWIDEFRITKGVGRYSTTFTPPTTAYPDF